MRAHMKQRQHSQMRYSLSAFIVILLIAGLLTACSTGPAPGAAEEAAPAPAADNAEAAPAADADAADMADSMEAPALAAMVTDGSLPALSERLPVNPKVVEPVDGPGQYGGIWRMGLRGGQDNALLVRTMAYEHLVRWTPDWTGIEPNI
ncbi:MAG: hypothetical protein KDE47_14660, partial [Caldilineaceae bacterium]|nr:hypothetical protein [Caldilineaceae bacterium]